MEGESLAFDDYSKQREMLSRILSTGDKDDDLELDDVNLADSVVDSERIAEAVEMQTHASYVAPRRTTLAKMTVGRDGILYSEGKEHQMRTVGNGGPQETHPFFKSFYKQN